VLCKSSKIQQELLEFSEDLRTSKKVLLKEYLTQIIEDRRKKYEREESLKNEGKE